MPRYRLLIEYDGAGFVGWQKQTNGLSVQEALSKAVFGFCGEQVDVTGAGRTDAGVHASGQTAHIDLSKEWPVDTIRDAINFHLRPHAVCVLAADLVADDFHARFDAVGREYRYVILNRKPPVTLERGKVWHVVQPLDAGAMQEAAHYLVGRHDFTTFRAAACQAKSPVKTVEEISVTRHGSHIVIEAKARSFLHNQVRSFAGTLKWVGEGKWRPIDVADALAARDRTRCGPVAPPDGLTLVAVKY
jgi:tRNA pseudouridine38-40 synthase